ncbi:MAG TPA: primosomal protein N' [Terriglobia bacterium]|nr:primosomal protein N' [Terriglobia bacterium]
MSHQKPSEHFVNVAVMAAIRNPLTYRVPNDLDVRLGQRVLVPLATRKATGLVLEPVTRVAPGVKMRDVLRVLDPEPVLSPELVTLGLWIAEYYLAPVGEVFRAMLPLRAETRRVRVVTLCADGWRRLDELNGSLLEEVRNSEEAALLRYLADRSAGVPVETVRQKFRDASPELIPRAIAEGFVTIARGERAQVGRQTWSVRLAGGGAEPIATDAGATVHGPVPDRPHKLSPVAKRIIEALQQLGPVEDHRELLKSARADLAALRKLRDRGVIQLADSNLASRDRRAQQDQQDLMPRPLSAPDAPAASGPNVSTGSSTGAPIVTSAVTTFGGPLRLTPAQTAVFNGLVERLEEREFGVTLLHGVTGSGKTEIYLQLITACLARGTNALMLVPEIALTPAMQAQFLARFGNQVALLHSGLGKTERHEEWWQLRRGEARVALGTRSSVFAPLENVGLVIVDEEHDSSYKQGETPRYHGRDVAIVRGRLERALVVLGSATPSLESYANARQGKYALATLQERVAGRPLAAVEIIDMREEFRRYETRVPISKRLQKEIETALAAGAQVMILLNRRGYSWFLLCRACGQTIRCVNCSISLTYHRREHRLMCHYCGYNIAVPTRCPECDSEYLYYVGEGTEKLEDKFAELFPGARVERLDRDTARHPAEYRKVLSDFRAGKIQILVGTQLIAKGHDFPGVTLVGVVSADLGLGLPDFRAAEHTFQLLTQAAGRAGRGDAPGRVLVQTFFPEHYAIRLAAEQNYEGFFSKEMRFRRMMHYPPAAALANIIAQDKELEEAARVATRIGEYFASLGLLDDGGARDAADNARPVDFPSPSSAPGSADGRAGGWAQGMRVLGPTPAPLARIEGRYRIQFLIKSQSRAKLNQVLRGLIDHCDQLGINPRSVMIDVDPVSVM